MACLHYWGSALQVGSHALARQFVAAGREVAYFSAPVTPLHLLKAGRDNLRERFAIWRRGPISDCDGQLKACVPLALFAPDNRPLLGTRFVLGRWNAFTFPNVASVAQRLGFGAVETLYLDNFYHSFWLDQIRARQSVYRMTDRNDGFPGYTAAMRSVEERLVQRVDLVVYPARSMEEYVAGMRPRRMLFLPNGIDSARFAPARRPEPALYRGIPTPRAVYLGAIDRWFDAELVARAARALPEISFVLAGPAQRRLDSLRELANVHLPGPVAPADTPALLEHAQLGLIPFDAARYPTLISPLRPLKLFEYLAAGLPVAATAWDELRALRSPALVCESADEFVQAVATLARAPKAAAAPLQAFARQFDWAVVFSSLKRELERGGEWV